MRKARRRTHRHCHSFTAEERLTCRRYASRCSGSRCSGSSPQATVFSAAAPTASFCPQ